MWGHLFGTIDTKRKFLDIRLELARYEWTRLKANDRLECRNCHSEVAMDLSQQAPRAAEIHTRFLLLGEATCIDCHKGIAHQLPDMSGAEPGWKMPPKLKAKCCPQHSRSELGCDRGIARANWESTGRQVAARRCQSLDPALSLAKRASVRIR